MYRLAFALTAVALFTGSASAADLSARRYAKEPVAPVALYNWTGCYVGANGGGARAHKENFAFDIPTTPSLGSHDATGGAVGGQIGCDYQAGKFLIGVRGMGDAAWLNGSNIIPQNAIVAYNTRIDAFGTATIRAGFLATPSFLLYVQGGGIWLRDRHQQLLPTPTVRATETQTRGGWTAGVGGEWMFAPNWSVFVEYNYAKFDDDRTCYLPNSCPGIGGAPGGINQKLDFQAALLGVNYHFNTGPISAKY